MAQGYHHVTEIERSQIETLKSIGMYQKDIAKNIGLSASTISRELTRNAANKNYNEVNVTYSALLANKISHDRRTNAARNRNKMSLELIHMIIEYLKEGWSPEQISGRLRLENKPYVSYETIYQYIYKDKANGGNLYKLLRRRGKKYKKSRLKHAGVKQIPNRVDISDREPIVNEKKRVGDFEGDTIVARGHKGGMLTLVDRTTKFIIIARLPRLTAYNVNLAIKLRLNTLASLIKTITFDNGSEFAGHQEITKTTKALCYFAKPFTPWERPLNEHTNGLIREYFPKGSDIRCIDDEKVMVIENKLNNRPRKSLGYKTPMEAWSEALRDIVTTAA